MEATRRSSNPFTLPRLLKAATLVRTGQLARDSTARLDLRGQIASYTIRRDLTEREIDQILNRYLAGESAAAIARDLGIDRRRVRKLAHEHDIARTRPRVSDQQITEAIRLYQDGLTLRQAADLVDTSEATLRRRFTDLGIARRNGRSADRSDDATSGL